MELLDELLAAYRATPCTELHALIVRASAGLAPPVPDVLCGRLKAAQAVWAERAKQPTSTDVPALLETLADAGSRVAVGRMEMVSQWKPDPRVDEQILRWIELPPWEGDIAKPFWREVFARMEKIRDGRIAERLTDRSFGGGNLDRIMYTWVWNARQRAAAAIANNLYDAKPDRRQLARLASKVDTELAKPKVTTPTARSKAELLDEIRKHPDDVAPRLVYADVLVAEGDPHGEFIAIQCSDEADDKRSRRAAQLLRKHGSTWLGPLARVLMKHYVFERGFLSRCVVGSQRRALVPALVGNPTWATVRALAGSTAIALDPIMVSLRELSFWGLEDRAAWKNLLVDVTRPIEHLAYTPSTGYREGIPADEFEALGGCVALPALRSLTVACTTDEFLALLRTPIATRLHGISAASAGGGFVYQGERWVADLIEACEVPVLELHSQLVLRVERTGEVTFTLTDPRQQVGVAVAMVPHLPATAKRVTIRATVNVTDAHRATIAKAVRARFGDIAAPTVVIPDELPNQFDYVI